MEVGYFFDTYALVEIVQGKHSYKEYQNVPFITTKLNLMELHHALLRSKTKEQADQAYDWFLRFCKEPDNETIKSASMLRKKFRRQHISFVDCIGYLTAQERGLLFLTGDKEFKEFPNVAWVQ
ncbi:MAG: PIN domain-containing protein [Candidatus Woesearchaeota archaeon]|nr:PIN domain-containing protein [Candidatus Woesearchaeota archaeon]